MPLEIVLQMRTIPHIIGSCALILAFGLFNVGLPVVLYLCPMMSSTSPACPMSNEGNAPGLSIVNQSAACCGKVIVAERHTTPFVKVQQPEHQKISLVILLDTTLQEHSFSSLTQTFDKPPPPGESQLFLLHSALLI